MSLKEFAGTLRVLVVDDKSFMRSMTGRILGTAGVKNISYAENGAEALKIIQMPESRISLVLTDIAMPDMDGVELTRRLSEVPNPPAIAFISGTDARLLRDAATMAAERKLVVIGAMAKPLSLEHVESLIEKYQQLRAASS